MWAVLLTLGMGIDEAPTVSVDELVRIHRTNEALADERFRLKPVIVTGKLDSVKRGGLLAGKTGDKAKQVYHLWMKAADGTSVGFRFTEDDRAALAKLVVGAEVRVRAHGDGALDKNLLHLFDCRLLAAPVAAPPRTK
jgi:hypothetical protein